MANPDAPRWPSTKLTRRAFTAKVTAPFLAAALGLVSVAASCDKTDSDVPPGKKLLDEGSQRLAEKAREAAGMGSPTAAPLQAKEMTPRPTMAGPDYQATTVAQQTEIAQLRAPAKTPEPAKPKSLPDVINNKTVEFVTLGPDEIRKMQNEAWAKGEFKIPLPEIVQSPEVSLTDLPNNSGFIIASDKAGEYILPVLLDGKIPGPFIVGNPSDEYYYAVFVTMTEKITNNRLTSWKSADYYVPTSSKTFWKEQDTVGLGQTAISVNHNPKDNTLERKKFLAFLNRLSKDLNFSENTIPENTMAVIMARNVPDVTDSNKIKRAGLLTTPDGKVVLVKPTEAKPIEAPKPAEKPKPVEKQEIKITLSPQELYKALLSTQIAPENLPTGYVSKGNQAGNLDATAKAFDAIGQANIFLSYNDPNFVGESDARLIYVVFPKPSDAKGAFDTFKAHSHKTPQGFDSPAVFITSGFFNVGVVLSNNVFVAGMLAIISSTGRENIAAEDKTISLVKSGLKHLQKVGNPGR